MTQTNNYMASLHMTNNVMVNNFHIKIIKVNIGENRGKFTLSSVPPYYQIASSVAADLLFQNLLGKMERQTTACSVIGNR